jgi:hypothetical protein
MKNCARCSVDKPDSEFGTRKMRGKTYLRSECKACSAARQQTQKTVDTSENDNATATAIEVDPVEQMRLMDGLSIELKRIIWDAPFRLDVRQASQLHKSCRLKAPQRLADAILAMVPDWVPG